MPQIGKKLLSQFIYTGCPRQLRLAMTPATKAFDGERARLGLPPWQPQRPGTQHLTRLGYEWQAQTIAWLESAFGAAALVCRRHVSSSGMTMYDAIPLLENLPNARAGQFIVEAEFNVGTTFADALGIREIYALHEITFATFRPDLIEVFDAATDAADRAQQPLMEVLPDGSLCEMRRDDPRLRLRIIDIKLTSSPNTTQFVEVVFYSMVLAGWLRDCALHDRFVVVHEAALWPGSHEVAAVVKLDADARAAGQTPTCAQLRHALQADLELAAFEVFAPRVRQILVTDVPAVLSRDWRDLDWHVDARCKSCEFVGVEWGQKTAHPDHCLPASQRVGHISRVAFLSRGARASLNESGIRSVADLAQRQATDAAFDDHYRLRAGRSVIAARAAALQTNAVVVPPFIGTSAMMPRWSDLRVYLTVDFDVATGITFAFGAKAFWTRPYKAAHVETNSRRWQAQAFIVENRSPDSERTTMLAFLDHIHAILSEATELADGSTYQIYLWNWLQMQHFARVVGRHLDAILGCESLARLAWLFPPDELMPNAALQSRRSPITIVRDVVRASVALPIPHAYSLLETARQYHSPRLSEFLRDFRVGAYFEDAMSDQIPSERAHDLWARVTSPVPWQEIRRKLTRAVTVRLSALETITRRLQEDFGSSLKATAPRIDVSPPERQAKISIDGQLWYAFAKLDAAVTDLETAQIRAMPAHEREARFCSARLRERLSGDAEMAELRRLDLPLATGLRVYRMRSASRDTKLRAGDFNVLISPELAPDFLASPLKRYAENTPLASQYEDHLNCRLEYLVSVSIVAIDREAGTIVIRPDSQLPTLLDDLAQHANLDFDRNVVLDPGSRDHFTVKKLLPTLQALGMPAIARDEPLVRRALGLGKNGRPHRELTPVAEVLWDAQSLANQRIARATAALRERLAANDFALNESQWRAWEHALTHRLSLIWGPPGTGKSRVLVAVLIAAVLDAAATGRARRILIVAPTYAALDNILLPIYERLRALLAANTDWQLHRLRSAQMSETASVPPDIDRPLSKASGLSPVSDLRLRIDDAASLTIVGATPEQTHLLLRHFGEKNAQDDCFDLIAIDEASQMDVAHAILPLAGLAENGSVVVAGDHLQLPPIHAAKPPRGLEAMVGSVFDFFRHIHNIAPMMLEENYRSNRAIVEFVRHAGYGPTLSSVSPNLTLDLIEPIPAETQAPPQWPSQLYWTPAWATLLDPAKPVGCFIYRDTRSSQSNPFEAAAIATLARLLYYRLANGLANEIDPATQHPRARRNRPYAADEFFAHGIGVVTPHRAQQALVARRLQSAFTGCAISPDAIRTAVDTVERFQGGERDVILASFAVGDPDMVADEEEFLLNLQRFNVLASRARAKLLVFLSESLVSHLASDREVLADSRLLKIFAESFCRHRLPLTLGYTADNGATIELTGEFRYAT